MKVIAREVERNGYRRTAYYKYCHEGTPKLVLNKGSAAQLPDSEAETILRQLNAAFGGGFEAVEV